MDMHQVSRSEEPRRRRPSLRGEALSVLRRRHRGVTPHGRCCTPAVEPVILHGRTWRHTWDVERAPNRLPTRPDGRSRCLSARSEASSHVITRSPAGRPSPGSPPASSSRLRAAGEQSPRTRGDGGGKEVATPRRQRAGGASWSRPCGGSTILRMLTAMRRRGDVGDDDVPLRTSPAPRRRRAGSCRSTAQSCAASARPGRPAARRPGSSSSARCGPDGSRTPTGFVDPHPHQHPGLLS